MLLLALFDAAEAKKPKTPPPPPVEWHREEGWRGDCWYPPEFGTMLEGDRKLARQRSLEQIKAQWLGQREDGVKFDDMVIDNVETVLFGRPTNIEAVATANLEWCSAYMKGGSADGWASWLSSLPAKLTEGECLQPMTYTLFDYLDLGHAWQRPIGFCKGDRVRISATVRDRYRIVANGEWINVEGDLTQKAIGADYPCNIEGCYVGMLIGRFVTEKGVETVFPIGAGTVYTAPEHGTFTYQINVTTFYDTRWFKSATIEDRAAITVEPAP